MSCCLQLSWLDISKPQYHKNSSKLFKKPIPLAVVLEFHVFVRGADWIMACTALNILNIFYIQSVVFIPDSISHAIHCNQLKCQVNVRISRCLEQLVEHVWMLRLAVQEDMLWAEVEGEEGGRQRERDGGGQQHHAVIANFPPCHPPPQPTATTWSQPWKTTMENWWTGKGQMKDMEKGKTSLSLIISDNCVP